MSNRKPMAAAGATLVAGILVASAGAASDPNRGLPKGSEPVTLNPADFTTRIDHPYRPMRPGSRWVYRETTTTGPRQRVTVTVTTQTKRIANGVLARVVRDVATVKGRRVEATDDWYAQDSAGNIWYLGEDTAEYAKGRVVNRHGSFEAGATAPRRGSRCPRIRRPGCPIARSTLRARRRAAAERPHRGDGGRAELLSFRRGGSARRSGERFARTSTAKPCKFACVASRLVACPTMRGEATCRWIPGSGSDRGGGAMQTAPRVRQSREVSPCIAIGPSTAGVPDLVRGRASSTAAAVLVAMLAQIDAAHARTVVRILDSAPLHSFPDGPELTAGGDALYERGSAWVVRRDGDWLGLPTEQRRNGTLGWIRASPSERLTTTRMLVQVDLSERRVRVTSGARPLMSAPVAIGAPRSPSPTGSTSVSARIPVTPSSGYRRGAYGPMIVALRLRQSLPSPGLPFGGTVAFHGGRRQGVGTASTGGCFGMRNVDVLRLASHVRAGTPVIIRR